jgi:hypothetical protein
MNFKLLIRREFSPEILRECLLIQLKDQDNVDHSLLTMVKNIDLIASGRSQEIIQAL